MRTRALIRVDQRDPRLGFVGDVREIDPTIVVRMLREELIPVIATVGVDDDGQAYNVNADTVAGAMAEALDAEKLVYLTDVAGVYGDWPDEASLISRIDVDGMEQLIADGKVSEGMIPKLESCVSALKQRRAAARTSSTAASRTRCCSSSSPAREWERWCDHERFQAQIRDLAARRRQRDADLRSAAGRVRARRGHEAVGQRGQASTSTSSPGSRSRRSATRIPRSPTRSPTRRARCSTSRTSITTTCSRGSRRG